MNWTSRSTGYTGDLHIRKQEPMTRERVHRGDSFERYVRRTRRLEYVALCLGVALVVGLVLMALAGCSSAPKHGRVIQKQYLAAHYDYHQASYCQAYVTHTHIGTRSRTINGRTSYSTYSYTTTDCALYGVRTWRTWVNDQWGLRLRDGDHTGYRYVDAITFGQCGIGQYYDDNGTCS